jgi:metal-dependent hydrolase (beta-lactamase superfamily II)
LFRRDSLSEIDIRWTKHRNEKQEGTTRVQHGCSRLKVLCRSTSCLGTFEHKFLKVTLLGTGSPVPVIQRFGPSTLVEAGPKKLLIDCGRGASARLWQRHVPLGAVTAVFLAHLHSDHIVGIPVVGFQIDG